MIKLNKEGVFKLRTSNREEVVSLNLEKGKEYFIKCGVKLQLIFEKPKLELVSNEIGQFEFNSFNSKN